MRTRTASGSSLTALGKADKKALRLQFWEGDRSVGQEVPPPTDGPCHDVFVAESMSEWRERLELEGSVTFRQSRRRIIFFLVGNMLFAAGPVGSLASDGPSVWAVSGVVLFGLGVVVFGRLLLVGAPTLTVTRTGLTRSGLREVAFSEIRELLTSKTVFYFLWAPESGEEPPRRSRAKRGLMGAGVPSKSVADPELLAQWVLRLKDPSAEIVVEPGYGGMGSVWRLGDAGT